MVDESCKNGDNNDETVCNLPPLLDCKFFLNASEKANKVDTKC